MRWGVPSVVAVLLAVALLTGAAAADGAATDGDVESDAASVAAQNATDDESNATANESSDAALSPGAQLAGVLAVQRTEIRGELDRRSFDARLAAAEGNDSKARVVSRELNQSRDRLAELRARLSSLEAARENGTISQGRYRAEAAHLTAEIRSVERQLDRTGDAAASLPEEAKRANGIDGDELERLREEARNLSGPSVATAARGVAANAGNGFGPGGANGERGAERGPPGENAGNGGPPADAGTPASTAAGNGSLPTNAGGERPENRSAGGPSDDADAAAPNERAGANGSGRDAAPTDGRPGRGIGNVTADGANPATGSQSDENVAAGVTETGIGTSGGTDTEVANESDADAANP